jgi:hypothetical protein
MGAVSALNKKRAAQAALQELQTFTITLTVTASQNNMQQLSALMMLQDPTKVIPPLEDLGPLPFDEVPAPPSAKPLELDYNLIRKEILGKLEPYNKMHGLEITKQTLRKHGGDRIRDIPVEHLLGLLAEVEAAIA